MNVKVFYKNVFFYVEVNEQDFFVVFGLECMFDYFVNVIDFVMIVEVEFLVYFFGIRVVVLGQYILVFF